MLLAELGVAVIYWCLLPVFLLLFVFLALRGCKHKIGSVENRLIPELLLDKSQMGRTSILLVAFFKRSQVLSTKRAMDGLVLFDLRLNVPPLCILLSPVEFGSFQSI